jgi:hypothetical protein
MAQLHGSFEIGGRITTQVKGNRRLTSTITRIEKPRLWTGVAKAPGVTMTIEHVIDPTDTGTLLTERMILSGPLAALVARLMGRRIESTFAATTAHAAEVAEAHRSSRATA